MSKTDNTLIYLRSENARIGLKELSRHLKKSPQRLKYSLSVLEHDEILNQPYCVFDYSYFGLILFRVYFKGAYIGEKDKNNIIAELQKNNYIISLYELSGEFDLVVEFASPNPSRFNKELKKIITLNPRLNDYKVILNVVTYIYPRHYLLEEARIHAMDPEIIIGGDREREPFDQKEMDVMKLLLQHPTIRFTRMAEKSGLNVKTAKRVFNNLKKRHIIKGFKYVLDTNKLSISRWRIFLRLHNLSIERESQLMEYLNKSNAIIQTNKTVGDWDLEVDIESPDKSRIRKIIVEIKEEFTDTIAGFNLIELYQYDMKAYLPRHLFEE